MNYIILFLVLSAGTIVSGIIRDKPVDEVINTVVDTGFGILSCWIWFGQSL